MHGKAGGLGLVGSRLSHPPPAYPVLRDKEETIKLAASFALLSVIGAVVILPELGNDCSVRGWFSGNLRRRFTLIQPTVIQFIFCIIFPPSICLPLSIPLARPTVPTLLRCLAVFACGKRRKVGNALFIKYLLDSCC